MFAAAGIAGAATGAHIGKMVDGHRLLLLFGVLMVVVGLMMLRPRKSGGNADVKLTRATSARLLPFLIGIGFSVGLLSGFFGIGGGFLIVPGLMLATGMPLINAVGSSLVSVAAFGFTTAASYAWSGLVDWLLAFLFIGGGALGGFIGIKLAHRMAGHKHALTLTFSGVVIAVGLYVIGKVADRLSCRPRHETQATKTIAPPIFPPARHAHQGEDGNVQGANVGAQ